MVHINIIYEVIFLWASYKLPTNMRIVVVLLQLVLNMLGKKIASFINLLRYNCWSFRVRNLLTVQTSKTGML